jgi:hypothetical protein
MAFRERQRGEKHILLKSRLAYHLRCLREDATDPERTSLERLTLVRDRVARVREIRRELEAVNVMDAERPGDRPR